MGVAEKVVIGAAIKVVISDMINAVANAVTTGNGTEASPLSRLPFRLSCHIVQAP